MTVTLDALVVPAFDDLDGLPGETEPWHERYDLAESLDVAGVPEPLRHDGRLGVVPTGVGKVAAATTVTALLSSPGLAVDGPICSVGVAGGPPDVSLGSVVVADTVLDWDDKCRFDGGELALNPYTGEHGVVHLDPDLVEQARTAAETVDLRRPGVDSEQGGGAQPAGGPPEVLGGVNVCGDELWHGHGMADQVEWLLDERGVGPYRLTQMEDVGTAAALARFDALDRYLTIRGVSNHDRPRGDRPPAESFADPAFEAGFGTAAENAVRVARHVIETVEM